LLQAGPVTAAAAAAACKSPEIDDMTMNTDGDDLPFVGDIKPIRAAAESPGEKAIVRA